MKKYLLLALIALMAAACSNQNRTNEEITSSSLQASETPATSDVEVAKNPNFRWVFRWERHGIDRATESVEEGEE